VAIAPTYLIADANCWASPIDEVAHHSLPLQQFAPRAAKLRSVSATAVFPLHVDEIDSNSA
jgi:hypothetical protein